MHLKVPRTTFTNTMAPKLIGTKELAKQQYIGQTPQKISAYGHERKRISTRCHFSQVYTILRRLYPQRSMYTRNSYKKREQDIQI